MARVHQDTNVTLATWIKSECHGNYCLRRGLWSEDYITQQTPIFQAANCCWRQSRVRNHSACVKLSAMSAVWLCGLKARTGKGKAITAIDHSHRGNILTDKRQTHIFHMHTNSQADTHARTPLLCTFFFFFSLKRKKELFDTNFCNYFQPSGFPVLFVRSPPFLFFLFFHYQDSANEVSVCVF